MSHHHEIHTAHAKSLNNKWFHLGTLTLWFNKWVSRVMGKTLSDWLTRDRLILYMQSFLCHSPVADKFKPLWAWNYFPFTVSLCLCQCYTSYLFSYYSQRWWWWCFLNSAMMKALLWIMSLICLSVSAPVSTWDQYFFSFEGKHVAEEDILAG